jgi:hypothetical protein
MEKKVEGGPSEFLEIHFGQQHVYRLQELHA